MFQNKKSQLNIIYYQLKCKYEYPLIRYLISRLFLKPKVSIEHHIFFSIEMTRYLILILF